jgi:hypothetical protein
MLIMHLEYSTGDSTLELLSVGTKTSSTIQFSSVGSYASAENSFSCPEISGRNRPVYNDLALVLDIVDEFLFLIATE